MLSGTARRSCIEREYDEAKETARAYLRALGVLDSGGISTREHRERDERLTRDGLRMGIGETLDFPSDPSATRATVLARRYLNHDRDDRIVEELLEHADSPANRVALEALKRELILMGAEVPDLVRAWEPKTGNPKRRWRREPTRNHRIGLVVEALVTGKNVLVRRSEPERGSTKIRGVSWHDHPRSDRSSGARAQRWDVEPWRAGCFDPHRSWYFPDPATDAGRPVATRVAPLHRRG